MWAARRVGTHGLRACEISRSGTSLLRRCLRGPGRDSSRPPPVAGPCGVQTLPCQAPDAAARVPGFPAWASGEGCGGGNRDANGDFLIYFSHGNLSLWLGLPIYFPLTSCWRSSSEGGSGGRSGTGRDGDWRGDLGPERGGEPRGKWALDPRRKRAKLKRPGGAELRASVRRRTESAP